MYESYNSVPSQSGPSQFDPVMLMVIPIGILICFMCACMACVCGIGIGYILRYWAKGQNIQPRLPTKPEYQQVAVESEREQVFDISIFDS